MPSIPSRAITKMNHCAPENKFGIDETLSIIVSRIENIDDYQDVANYDEPLIIFGEHDYKFISTPNNIEYSNHI